MRGGLSRRVGRVLLVAVLAIGVTGVLVYADADCWCAQYVDLHEDVPTRSGSILLRTAANVGLIGLTFWGVDYFGMTNPDWVKTGALVSGVANIGSAFADLLLPTERGIERDSDAIADTMLDEALCQETLAGYAGRVATHRFIKSAIDIGSGLAQIFLLSPYGSYATGEFYDYVYLVTGAIDLIGGTIKALFSTPFERDYREARATCGH